MLNKSDLQSLIQGRNILVTGGTGTIGSALVKAILRFQPEVLRIFSRDETKQFHLCQQLQEYNNIRYLIGDIRDASRLNTALKDVDLLFHAAALKHVPACEYNPFEAVKTNIVGTENIIEQSIAKNVKLVIGISTDKVVNPSSLMGTTKLVAEKLLIAANITKGKHQTAFSNVRFGNVAGARGSVIPAFLEQLRVNRELTVTDPRMTRFIMRVEDAVNLLLKAAQLSLGGETFILPMPSVKITDIAAAITKRYHDLSGELISIKFSGLRPGEKLHEELMTQDELARAYQYKGLWILPPEKGELLPGTPLLKDGCQQPVINSSKQVLITQDEILKLVRDSDQLNILKWPGQPLSNKGD